MNAANLSFDLIRRERDHRHDDKEVHEVQKEVNNFVIAPSLNRFEKFIRIYDKRHKTVGSGNENDATETLVDLSDRLQSMGVFLPPMIQLETHWLR